MGLTIHYSLRSRVRSPTRARQQVSQLRQRALDLPFESVGEVVEYTGDECEFEPPDTNDRHRWLKIQSGIHVEERVSETSSRVSSVPASHIIAFTTRPGNGCEPANFGLCRYPPYLELTNEKYVRRKGFVIISRKLPTNRHGWCWGSFCKTQYSSDPGCGGLENFLRCHLSVIRLLDKAQDLGLVEQVDDEGGYWKQRDVEALAKEVGSWNEMIAAFVGQLKDRLGNQLVAPITAFPDFEHLEARGQRHTSALF
jgi:hypothetical protein